jgi:hypothetical protein
MLIKFGNLYSFIFVLQFFSFVGSYSSSNLILYYPMNGNANDFSVNEFSGNPSGVTFTSSDRFGVSNYASYFDGSTASLNLGSRSSFTQNTVFTFMFWMKAVLLQGTIVWAGGSGAGLAWIITIVNHKIIFEKWGQGNAWITGSTLTTSWTHVAVQVDSGGTGLLYVNAAFVGSSSAGPAFNLPNPSSIIVGKRPDNLDFFKGNLDDIFFYDRVLTSSEIYEIYLNGAPSSQPSGSPTAHPSRQPSRQPSSQPTCQPSSQPLVHPSSQPSRHPSSQPSGRPSSQPSRQPTSQPTCQPSAQPSSQPCRGFIQLLTLLAALLPGHLIVLRLSLRDSLHHNLLVNHRLSHRLNRGFTQLLSLRGVHRHCRLVVLRLSLRGNQHHNLLVNHRLSHRLNRGFIQLLTLLAALLPGHLIVLRLSLRVNLHHNLYVNHRFSHRLNHRFIQLLNLRDNLHHNLFVSHLRSHHLSHGLNRRFIQLLNLRDNLHHNLFVSHLRSHHLSHCHNRRFTQLLSLRGVLRPCRRRLSLQSSLLPNLFGD